MCIYQIIDKILISLVTKCTFDFVILLIPVISAYQGIIKFIEMELMEFFV